MIIAELFQTVRLRNSKSFCFHTQAHRIDVARHTGRTFALLALAILIALPAFSQQLAGTFHPLKPVNVSGEPVWIVFQLTNEGKIPVFIDQANPYGLCALMDYSFDVTGAKPTGPWRCGAYGGSCVGGGIKQIEPGETYEQKLLLNQWFAIDHAGIYRVIASRQLRFGLRATRIGLLAPEQESFQSRFEVNVINGSERVVENAYEPFLLSLNKGDSESKTEAVETITAMAPPFLEKTIVGFAKSDDALMRSRAITALGRLNTPLARQVLVKLIEDRDVNYSGQAIDALAGTHDRSYAPLLEKLAKDPAWQRAAIPALGKLGGSSVIWFLAPLIYYPSETPDRPPLQQLAVRGLANTGSRDAIPFLIQAIRDPLVHEDAVNGLESLTHFVIFQRGSRHPLYAKDNETAQRMARKWQRWWRSEGRQARVYDPDGCSSSPEELPEQ